MLVRPTKIRTLGQSNSAQSVTGTASETTLATITIPARSMGESGTLFITTVWSYTNSANAKSCRVRFSGASGTQFLAVSPTTTASMRAQCQIGNRASTSSQVGGPSGATAFGVVAASPITSSVDTTVDTTVVITGQLANTGETLTLEAYTVELLLP